MNDNFIIKPTTLSIITTNKCTASCENCCFQCSPNKKDMLSIEDMKNYIKQAVEAYNTLKVCVFTGGECFLYGDSLNEIVNFASSYGLVTRVVTNGFWAKDYEKAYSILEKLALSGLGEINFSTGDDHLKYVSFDTIKNGIIASMELNLTTIVNVESNIDRNFKADVFWNDETLNKYLKSDKPFGIINGMWLPLTKKTERKINTSCKDNRPIYIENKDRCTSLFNAINITPTHHMVACCGLTCRYIKYLNLGSLKKHSIKFLYENQYNDYLKIWLSTDGPYRIMNFLKQYIDLDYDYENMHPCGICEKIFNNPKYLSILEKEYNITLVNTFFKHIFNKKEVENEISK